MGTRHSSRFSFDGYENNIQAVLASYLHVLGPPFAKRRKGLLSVWGSESQEVLVYIYIESIKLCLTRLEVPAHFEVNLGYAKASSWALLHSTLKKRKEKQKKRQELCSPRAHCGRRMALFLPLAVVAASWTGDAYDGSSTAVLLREYVLAHGASVLSALSAPGLLARRYIVAPYCCPASFGDYTGQFLDGVALGVETDTTVLWEPVSKRPDDCDGVLQRREWVPAAQTVVPELASAWMRRARLTDSNITAVVTAAVNGKRWAIALKAMGLLLSAGSLHERRLARDGPQVGNATREVERRQLLLYSRGVPMARGALFELAYAINETVLLRGVEVASVVYSVHLRHYNASDDGTQGGAAVARILRNLLPPAFTGACTVLIASDRPGAIPSVRNASGECGCAAVALKLRPAGNTRGRRLAVHSQEHGPWGRQASMVLEDIALLSLATSGFIAYGGGAGGRIDSMRLSEVQPAGTPHQLCLAGHYPIGREAVPASPLAKLRISSYAARAYERAAFRTHVLRKVPLPLHLVPKSSVAAPTSVPPFCTWLPQPWTPSAVEVAPKNRRGFDSRSLAQQHRLFPQELKVQQAAQPFRQ